MSGIRDRVAVVGMGCTRFGERWDASAGDLMVEAAYEAYEDAGLEAGDIQAAWLGTVSSFRTGQPLAEALKLDYIPITRVENACATATDAFRNACYAVAAGVYDIVLAMGVGEAQGQRLFRPGHRRRSRLRRRAAHPSAFPICHGCYPLLPPLRHRLQRWQAYPGPNRFQKPSQRDVELQGPLPARMSARSRSSTPR